MGKVTAVAALLPSCVRGSVSLVEGSAALDLATVKDSLRPISLSVEEGPMAYRLSSFN